MTTLTVRPLRPALSLPSSLCTSQNRPAPTKLSLLIPSASDPNALSIPSPTCRSSGTPIAGKKPKLSLNFGNDAKRTFTTSGSFSSSKLSSYSPSDDESNTSQEDITSRNTIINAHIASNSCSMEYSYRWTRSYPYATVSGKRSILKGSPSCKRSGEKLCQNVTFKAEHTVIPSSSSSDDEEYEIIPSKHDLEDLENMSPPSTTSSTDSEESESDSEPKTPVDEEDSRGRSSDRLASGPPNAKWRRPKREWVWTLGGSDSNDIMQELEYSSASLMQVEAI